MILNFGPQIEFHLCGVVMSGEKMTRQQLSDILMDFCSHTFLVCLSILGESTSNRVNQNVERTHNLSLSAISTLWPVTFTAKSVDIVTDGVQKSIFYFSFYICVMRTWPLLFCSLWRSLLDHGWLTCRHFAMWLEDMQGTTRDATRKEKKKKNTSDHNARHVSKWVKWEKHLYLSTTVCFWRPLPFCAHWSREAEPLLLYITKAKYRQLISCAF